MLVFTPFLAEISDVMQKPHPIYGIPLGVGLLVLVLYQLFKSPQNHNNQLSGKSVELFTKEEIAEFARQHEQAKSELEQRMELAREKIIELGLATSENVNHVIYNMSVDEFKRHFAGLQISRGLFNDQTKH